MLLVGLRQRSELIPSLPLSLTQAPLMSALIVFVKSLKQPATPEIPFVEREFV